VVVAWDLVLVVRGRDSTGFDKRETESAFEDWRDKNALRLGCVVPGRFVN
jgi:hypothetical protein